MTDQELLPNSPVDTYFAPAGRASQADLQRDIQLVSHNPLMNAVMNTAGGLLLVLNQQRQVLAINTSLLHLLGIADAGQTLGLRPGEVLNCSHAHDHTGGCGTGPACTSCGAAIAIITCQHTHQAAQRECILTVDRDDEPVDFYFEVRCQPVDFCGQDFLLLFLRDITIEQQHSVVERVFFHDFNNILQGLVLNSQLLEMQSEPAQMHQTAHKIVDIAERMAKEIAIQKAITRANGLRYPVLSESVRVPVVMKEACALVHNHPAAAGKGLTLEQPLPAIDIITDRYLLQRILINMLVNALEASQPGQSARMWVEPQGDWVSFHVWSRPVIPPATALRIFQRNFSTKQGSGRGLGTYAMKLFGEAYLKGKVGFTTSEADGTVFTISLPVQPA